MKRSSVIGAALALAVGVLASEGRAQTTEGSGSSARSYYFSDDDLLGDTLSTPPPLLRGPHRSPRILLLRPRVMFVAELLESMQTL